MKNRIVFLNGEEFETVVKLHKKEGSAGLETHSLIDELAKKHGLPEGKYIMGLSTGVLQLRPKRRLKK